MARDGSLRPLFRSNLPEAMWTSVETGLTGAGVPDAHYLFQGGASGWVEFKDVPRGNAVRVRPEQAAWLSRYARLGGRCFVIVRHFQVDLLIYRGADAPALRSGGLSSVDPLGRWGRSKWDWAEVRAILTD